MNGKYGLLLMLILFILLPGCQTLQVEETSVPAGLGIDMEKDKFKVTAQLAKPVSPEQAPPEEGKPQFVAVTARGDTASEALRRLLLTLPQIPLWTHASIIIIGEEAARRDTSLFVDLLSRTPEIRKNATLVITRDTTPEEIMQVQIPLEPFSARAINQLLTIQQKQLGFYVPVKMGEFLRQIITPGIDPIVPQVTISRDKETELLKLNGAAVFRKSVMVGHFNEDETRGYRWLTPGLLQGGIFNIPSPDNPRKIVAVELLRSQADIEPEIKGNTIRMKITLDAEGNFYEQSSPGEVLTLANLDKMEKTAAREIEKNIALAIKRSQELNSDIFGWGQVINNKYPDFWKEVENNWYDYYPQVEADIEVKFKFRRSYLTDQSFVFR